MASDPRYPGVSSYERKGHTYWRFRRDGKTTQLPGRPGENAFEIAYEKLAGGLVQQVIHHKTVQVVGDRRVPEKTFWHAWLLFKKSPEFLTDMDKPTQLDHTRKALEFCAAKVFDDLEFQWDEVPISEAEPKYLRAYLDGLRREFPTKPRHMLRTIRKLVAVAIAEKWIEPEQDPTLSLKYKKTVATPQKLWPLEVCAKFEARHPVGTMARTAYAIARYLGNRREDVASLEWSHMVFREIEDGEYDEVFDFRQAKNRKKTGGQHMLLSIPDPLREALDAIPRKCHTVLFTEYGKPYSGKALTNHMQRWTEQAEIDEGYTLHGLRRTFGTSLAENDVNAVAIQHAMGHANLSTTQLYIAEANRAKSMMSVKKTQDRVAAKEAPVKQKITEREAARKRAEAGPMLRLVKTG